MHSLTLCLYFQLFDDGFLKLAGALWKRLGTPGGSFEPTWAHLEHLGGATGQGKRTDDDTWCAMVVGFGELLIFRLVLYNVLKSARIEDLSGVVGGLVWKIMIFHVFISLVEQVPDCNGFRELEIVGFTFGFITILYIYIYIYIYNKGGRAF